MPIFAYTKTNNNQTLIPRDMNNRNTEASGIEKLAIVVKMMEAMGCTQRPIPSAWTKEYKYPQRYRRQSLTHSLHNTF